MATNDNNNDEPRLDIPGSEKPQQASVKRSYSKIKKQLAAEQDQQPTAKHQKKIDNNYPLRKQKKYETKAQRQNPKQRFQNLHESLTKQEIASTDSCQQKKRKRHLSHLANNHSFLKEAKLSTLSSKSHRRGLLRKNRRHKDQHSEQQHQKDLQELQKLPKYDEKSSLAKLQKFLTDSKESRDSMDLVYYAWEKDELDKILDLFSDAEGEFNIDVQFDKDNVAFRHADKNHYMVLGREIQHFILSCNVGPINTIMKLLYHSKHEGPVDDFFEWYWLVRNTGAINSRDKIKYHNQSYYSPLDTQGEFLRHNKGVGQINTVGRQDVSGKHDSPSSIRTPSMRPNPYKT